jgi:CHAT domain-containing protein/tetratricopeptide (TPR) repeat protein
MINKLFILVGLFCWMNLKSAGQCPEERFIVEKINSYKDTVRLPVKKFPLKERVKELQSYLNTIVTCPYRNDSTHVNLLRALATLYSYEGDYFNAAKYMRQSFELIAANPGKPLISRERLLSGYVWLSIFYDSLHNVPQKMEAIDNCIMAAEKLKAFSDLSAVKVLLFKTEHLFDIGDYHNCLRYANLCEKFAWQAVDAYKAQPSYSDNVRRIAMSSIGWRVEALLKLKEYTQAEQLIKDNFQVIQKANLNDFSGMIYDQLAQVEINKGDREQAVHLLELALKKHELAGDYFNCKQVSKNIGDNYFRILRDDKNALRYYKKALDYKNKKGNLQHQDSMESLAIFGRIANVYVNKNRFDVSDQYFQLAFDNFTKGSNENFIFQVPSEKVKGIRKVDYLAVLLLDRADAYKKQYLATKYPEFLARAIKAYKIADRFLDTIKIALTDPRSKLFWRSSAKRLYENAIGACYLQKNLNDAFYFFEKSRAVLLQDQLKEQRWLGDSDIMKQTQLNKKISQLEKELSSTDKSPEKYSELQTELLTTKQEFEKLREVIKTNSPLYYQNFVSYDSITIADVKAKILKDHAALVELFDGDSAVYVLAITKQESYLEMINKTAFENLSTAYVRYLSNQGLLNRDFDSFADISNQLYELIFGKINLPAGRIIISPDGRRYFPFESLVTKQKPPAYFVENYAVSYTYSARYLLNDFLTNSTSSSHTFIGIAPVHFNGLDALSGSDQSLENIQPFFKNATSLVGANATKNNFLTEYYRYKIVQLYTHATDSSTSGDPAINFADSTLLLSDLFYENKPATSLIVLSACETANGKLYNGEGVFSFNRQFAALGIPTCVSTLWRVDNHSTYQITELFYKYLAKGLPLDVALQSAKKELIHSSNAESRLPYYWAAPILVGKSDSIPLQKPFPWKWATGAMAILALLSLGGWQARKRRIQKAKQIPNLVVKT